MIGQPIYLLIAVVVSSAIIAVFFITLNTMTIETQRFAVEHEVDKLLSQAVVMFEYADEGALVTVRVDFPSSMRFIVFGSLPQNSTQQPTNLNRNWSMSNDYYYVMVDGAIHTGHANVYFSAKNNSQIALFHPGSYDLTPEAITRPRVVRVRPMNPCKLLINFNIGGFSFIH